MVADVVESDPPTELVMLAGIGKAEAGGANEDAILRMLTEAVVCCLTDVRSLKLSLKDLSSFT